MTIAANRPAPVLSPGAAQESLREMAAVIRTVFGVGLQASRQAAVLASAAPEPVLNEVEAAPAAPEPAGVTTGSIPVPGMSPTETPANGIPVPGMPVSGLSGIPVPEVPEAPAATTGSIPMPTLPLPEVPEAEAPQIQTEPQPQPHLVPVPTSYVAPEADEEPVDVPALVVPALAVVPQPVQHDVSNEKRAAVLQELAFLDD